MLLLPRNIQALACCAGACLQSFCTWGNFNRRKWGFFNRRKLGNIQPALTACTQRQMQLASTSAPRSATSSATCSYDRGYRRYKRTHKMMSSPGCCRPLNGLSGPIGIDFYPTNSPGAKFATEPANPVPAFVLCVTRTVSDLSVFQPMAQLAY